MYKNITTETTKTTYNNFCKDEPISRFKGIQKRVILSISDKGE